MDALVASQISQMKAYADLISTLEKGLASFKAGVASGDAVVAWLQKNIPEVVSNGVINKNPPVLSQSSANVLNNLYKTSLPGVILLSGIANAKQFIMPADANGALPTDWSKIGAGYQLVLGQIGNLPGQVQSAVSLGADNTGNVVISLVDAVATVLDNDATVSYNQLDTLVKLGMTRIVVTDGHILTKMTFQFSAADSSDRVSTDVFSSSTTHLDGQAAVLGIFGEASSSSANMLRVNIATERTTTSTQILATVMGEVLVNFRSDYFPALTSQAKP